MAIFLVLSLKVLTVDMIGSSMIFSFFISNKNTCCNATYICCLDLMLIFVVYSLFLKLNITYVLILKVKGMPNAV